MEERRGGTMGWVPYQVTTNLIQLRHCRKNKEGKVRDGKLRSNTPTITNIFITKINQGKILLCRKKAYKRKGRVGQSNRAKQVGGGGGGKGKHSERIVDNQ